LQASLDNYAAGAGLATDLVNSTPGVWHGNDQLADLAALGAFLAGHDLHDETPTDADLDAVHALRPRLRAVIDLRDPAAITTAAAALTGAAGGLTLADRHWCVVARPGATLPDRLALLSGVGVLGAVRALGSERFRDCASGTCSGAFIDTSRPGRRRYCMPDLCGNRANVAAYRERRRAGN